MKLRPALCSLAVLLPLAGAVTGAQAQGLFDGRFDGNFDGALTLVSQRGPEYLGARDFGVSARPGIFLRWKRLSVSSGGGWAAVRRDDELRGLGLELTRSDTLRVSLGLRVDSGRDESDSTALRGMGDIKRTIRARIGGTWNFAPDWQLGGSWTVDAFGRGGGNLAEFKVQHDWRLSPRMQLTSAATVAVGGPKYMQTYFGVTAEQAARSGYAEYDPGMSLRDVAVYTTLRADLGEDWVALIGVGYGRTLGDATRSPLTQRPSFWTMTAGAGWRF
jgi:MipA family protein